MTTIRKKDEGSATPALAVGMVAIVLLIIVISLGFYLLKNQQDESLRTLHTYQEQAAYKYAEKRTEATEMKKICDNNTKTFETLKAWVNQKQLKPPPEYLANIPCAVTIIKEEEKK